MRYILILILLGCMTSSVKSYYNIALEIKPRESLLGTNNLFL